MHVSTHTHTHTHHWKKSSALLAILLATLTVSPKMLQREINRLTPGGSTACTGNAIDLGAPEARGAGTDNARAHGA
eukprot:1684675-Rhodomonas_salina.2